MTLNEHDLEHRDGDAPPPTPDAYGAPPRRHRRKGAPPCEEDSPAAPETWGDESSVITSLLDFALPAWDPPKKLPTPEELEAEFLEPEEGK